MATIEENLTTLYNIKTNIRLALVEKGAEDNEDFTTYADTISSLEIETAKENKTLILLTTGDESVVETTLYETLTEDSVIETNTLEYRFLENGAVGDIDVISSTIFTNYGNTTTITVTYNGQETTANSLDEAFLVIYENAQTTTNTGMNLVNEVNTLSASYNLTCIEYSVYTTIERFTYEEPAEEEPTDTTAAHDDGYNTGYNDYAGGEYNDTAQCPYDETNDADNYNAWISGYGEGWTAAESETNAEVTE